VSKKKKKDSEIIKLWLPCVVTDSECLELAKQMSQLCKQKDDVEAEKARVGREFQKRIKDLSGEISGIKDVINTGLVNRHIACEKAFDYRNKLCITTRIDTGEIVEERPLYEDELQEEFDL